MSKILWYLVISERGRRTHQTNSTVLFTFTIPWSCSWRRLKYILLFTWTFFCNQFTSSNLQATKVGFELQHVFRVPEQGNASVDVETGYNYLASDLSGIKIFLHEKKKKVQQSKANAIPIIEYCRRDGNLHLFLAYICFPPHDKELLLPSGTLFQMHPHTSNPRAHNHSVNNLIINCTSSDVACNAGFSLRF